MFTGILIWNQFRRILLGFENDKCPFHHRCFRRTKRLGLSVFACNDPMEFQQFQPEIETLRMELGWTPNDDNARNPGQNDELWLQQPAIKFYYLDDSPVVICKWLPVTIGWFHHNFAKLIKGVSVVDPMAQHSKIHYWGPYNERRREKSVCKSWGSSQGSNSTGREKGYRVPVNTKRSFHPNIMFGKMDRILGSETEWSRSHAEAKTLRCSRGLSEIQKLK